ncbi:MAG: ATPase, T2SS/T4P/T4SS family [Acidithiobacillus ferrivorans]
MKINFGAQPDETVEKKESETESQLQDLPTRPITEENVPTGTGNPNLNIECFMPGASDLVEVKPEITPGETTKIDETEVQSTQPPIESRERDNRTQKETGNAIISEQGVAKLDTGSAVVGGNRHISKMNYDMLMAENSKRLVVKHHSVGAGLTGRPFACASANARSVLGDLAEGLAGDGAAPWLIYRSAAGIGCVMGVDTMTDLDLVKSRTENFFAQNVGEQVNVSVIEFSPGEIARLKAVASSTDPVRQAVTAIIRQTDEKADLVTAFKQCGVTRATLTVNDETAIIRLERFGGGKDSFSLEAPQSGGSLLAACKQVPNFLVLDDMAISDTEPFDRVAVDFDHIQHAFNRESSSSIVRVGGYGYGVVVIAGRNGSGKTTTALSVAERCASGMDGAVAVIGMRANGSSRHWIQITADAANPEAWKKATIAPANIIVVKVTSGDDLAGAHIQDAASRGKMVIVSMDASSIPEAISSLTSSGMDATFVVNSVHLVAVQSLIPAICPDCAIKDDRETTYQEMEDFPLWRKSLPENGSILLKKKGVGCPTCKMTGYIGLNPIIEILDIEQADKEVRKYILNGEFVDVLASINIQKRGWAAGMSMVVRGEIDAADLSRTVRKVVTGK